MNEEIRDEITTNLRLISLIKVNEKISVRKGHLRIDRETNVQSIKRWFRGDCRDDMIFFLRNLLKKLGEIELPNRGKFKNELSGVEVGLNNIKTTYSEDPVVVVQMENIWEKLNNLLAE
tara:strand:- start:1532 stop:1888 length:357 start_codon:yes stop_codon:yes gene_type:complete